ncbi:TAXI family TRAP transporter solute-binding subunit [Halioglobus maricola]|nr:TAXI family TRAP transporter solute-binding subunit [Halioglobus maricola]
MHSLIRLFFLLPLLSLVACEYTGSALRMQLIEYRQVAVEAVAGILEEQSNLRVEEAVEASHQAPLTALTEGTAELALVENSTSFVPGIRAVLPIFESVLHIAASNVYEANNSRRPLEGASFYVANGSAAGIAFVDLVTRRQELKPGDYILTTEFVPGETDFIVYFGPIDPSNTQWMRPDFALFSLDNDLNPQREFYKEGIGYSSPKLKSKEIPAFTYDLPGNDQPLLSVAVDTLLVTHKRVSEAAIYELTRTFLEQKPRFTTIAPHIFSGINESFDPLDLNFPLHRGARAYLERDDPSFIERYAETINMMVYVSFLMISAFLGFARWRDRKKKDRVDVFYTRVMEVRDQDDRPAKDRLTTLDELEREAFDWLIKEKLSANESFRIFTDLLATAREEINSGKE